MLEDPVALAWTSRIAADISARLPELAASMVHHYEREVPRLVRDDEQMVGLLAASVLENVQTAVHVFQHGMDPDNVEAPAAALEYARRLAQRGTPVVDLVRAYNLGQTLMLDHALEVAVGQVDDAALLGSIVRHVMTRAAALIDRVVQQAVTAYEDERDHWQLNRSAMRAVQVRALLDDTHTSTKETEAALGYDLSRSHLGLVAWCHDSPDGRDVLDMAGPVVARLADRLGCASEPLMVAHDETTAWVWLPLHEDGPIEPDMVETALAAGGNGVRIAVGEPGTGLVGFRRTHQQALRVHSLALVAKGNEEPALWFRMIGPIALMADDLPAARVWVGQTLGALAGDDESNQRLRETLLAFLTAGSSYTAAAAALTLHKNSVQYRVRRAEMLLGHPVTENRFNVETALSLCRWLGAAVLS